MQMRNTDLAGVLKERLTAIIDRQSHSSEHRDTDVGLLYDIAKDFAQYIRDTRNFDVKIAALLKQADELLSLTLRQNLLIHIAHTYKSEYTDNYIVRFLREIPDYLERDFVGIFDIIHTYLKSEKCWSDYYAYQEKVIKILAEIIRLSPRNQEQRIALIDEFLPEISSKADASNNLYKALLQCIKTASDNHDLVEIKSLIELGSACDIEISDKHAVDELVLQLKESIENHNHPKFLTLLSELQSNRYQRYFYINAVLDQSGTTLLGLAIVSGNVKAIRMLLDAGANKARLNADILNTAQIAAIRDGENQLMDKLLELGADANYRIDESGISTLHVAAMYGRVDIFKKLLSLNLSPLNLDCHGDSPLSIAVKRNDVNAVKILINHIIDKSYPANQFLNFLKFNRHLEYLLVSSHSPEVLHEICRLIGYLEQKHIPHNEIEKLKQGPLVSSSQHPFMKDHEHDNYYTALSKSQLTTYHDFLKNYYQQTKMQTLVTMAIDSQNLMAIKMLLVMGSGSAIPDADLVKLNKNIELLRELDTDFPVVVDTLLESELKKLPQYAKNNDINSIKHILDLMEINPDKRHAALLNHMTNQHVFRDTLVAAKNGRLCIQLFNIIGLLESYGNIDHKDLLPKKYIFANSNLKEDIFTAIKAQPLAHRIKKYNSILNNKDSVFYHIFHMKRGYIFGVSEKRGILHDISQAYENDKAELNQLQKAAPANLPAPIKQESRPAPPSFTPKIYPNPAAVSLPPDEGAATILSLKVESNFYPDLKQFQAPQVDLMQQYLDQAKQRQAAVITPPVLLNPFTDKPLPTSAVSPVTTGSLMAIDAILMAPKAPKHASWLAELNEIDFSQTEPSSTAVIMNQLGDLISFEEPAKPDVNKFDGLVELEKQPVAAKPGYTNPFDDVTDEQHDDHVAAQLAALPQVPRGDMFFATQKDSQSNTNESGKKRIAALN